MTEKGFYWHVHHDKLYEWCYDYHERVDYIKKNKPKKEIEIRLKLFKKVEGKLPKELVETFNKYYEAGKKYDEADEKFDEARKKSIEARKKCDEARKKSIEARKKFDEARKKSIEARKKFVEAGKKFVEARKKCDETLKKYKPQLEKLHAKECGCKYWNGEEIDFDLKEAEA